MSGIRGILDRLVLIVADKGRRQPRLVSRGGKIAWSLFEPLAILVRREAQCQSSLQYR
jgi:hypothetical protein